jgi:polyhydroxyalkanoate synthesis regulator protein
MRPTGAIIIARYAGRRRLYDTARLIYLTGEDLAEMDLNGGRFCHPRSRNR